MATTTKLGLPIMEAASSQKHVTHNDALLMIDALTHISLTGLFTNTPPGSPTDGVTYIIGGTPTGAWVGKSYKITVYQDGTWRFYNPKIGFTVYDQTAGSLLVFNGTNWVGTFGTSLANLDMLGIKTTADSNNRLAVKANSFFFSHDDVTPGTGDIRGTLNKSTAAKDASLDFKTNWSGRALMGLIADDDMRLKVSPDGTTYYEAWNVDRSSGLTRFPNNISVNNILIDTVYAGIKGQAALIGPSSIRFDASGNLAWTGRFINIVNGKGSHWSTSGYYDISMPSVGTTIQVDNGAASVTVTASGIPLAGWQALYYVPTVNGDFTFNAANFRIYNYTVALKLPVTAILIAIIGADTSECRLGCGEIIWPSDDYVIRTSAYRSRRNQSAFTAYGNSGPTIVGPTQVIYLNKQTDRGNDYSTTTGKFTAPENGLYFFTTSMLQVGSATLQGGFRKNSVGLSSGRLLYSAPGTGAIYTTVTGSIVLDLLEGDTIEVYLDAGSIFGGSDLLTFSGFRLSTAK